MRARVVINATGVWADQLRRQIQVTPRVRPLRGSHLVFPAWRFPVAQAIAFRHPLDRRYVIVVPWEDVTLVGTTDLDHQQTLDEEPAYLALWRERYSLPDRALIPDWRTPLAQARAQRDTNLDQRRKRRRRLRTIIAGIGGAIGLGAVLLRRRPTHQAHAPRKGRNEGDDGG